MTVAPSLLEELANAANVKVEKKLDAQQVHDVPRIDVSEGNFRWLLNEVSSAVTVVVAAVVVFVVVAVAVAVFVAVGCYFCYCSRFLLLAQQVQSMTISPPPPFFFFKKKTGRDGDCEAC